MNNITSEMLTNNINQKRNIVNIAGKMLISILTAFAIFHISIILRIIPYEITWGGRLESDAQMYIFETISLIVNLFLLTTVFIKVRYLKPFLPLKIVNIVLWVFVVFFGLNTIGNLLAKTALEKTFAVVTLLTSVLLWIILVKDKNY